MILKKIINDYKNKQFILFIWAGGFAALVNYFSRFIFSLFVTFGIAVILAYITGMITSFVLNKLFVFKNSIHDTKRQFLYFSLVNILAIIQTYIISVGLVYYIFPYYKINYFSEAIAHAIGVIFPVFTSFLGHKYLSFKSN